MVWSYSSEPIRRLPELNCPGTPTQRPLAHQGVSLHARRNSTLSLATGPILLIRRSPRGVHSRPQPSTQPVTAGLPVHKRPHPSTAVHSRPELLAPRSAPNGGAGQSCVEARFRWKDRLRRYITVRITLPRLRPLSTRPGFSEEFVDGIWHGWCPMIGDQGHLRAH